MKKILAVIMTFFIFGCPVNPVCAEPAAAEMLITNGSFSENASGWIQTSGADAGFSSSEGNSDLGSLFIDPVSPEEGAQTTVTFRKYKWYHMCLYVKMNADKETEGDYFLSPKFKYTDGGEEKTSVLFDRTLLKKGEWTKVEGYFQAPVLSVPPAESTEENLYIAGALQFVPDFVGEGKAFAPFYMDDVSIEGIDGGMNSNFTDGIQYWDFDGIETRIPFKTAVEEDENLAELDAWGAFPDVENIYRFDPPDADTSCIGPAQNIAMDSGVNYEISVWLKGENVKPGDNAFLVLDRSFDGTNYGDNLTAIGKVDVADGNWHRIKALVNFPKDSNRKSGDARVYVCISNGSRYNSNNAGGRNILMARFAIQKQDNLIQNPYFIITGKEQRSLDHQALKQPDNMDPWRFEGELCIEYNAQNTYDGSKYYAKNTVSDGGKCQTVSQAVDFLSRDYTLSVWAKLDDSYPADTALGYIYAGGENNPISEKYPLTKERWSKITVPSYDPVDGETIIGLAVESTQTDAAQKSILFADFMICENNDVPVDITEVDVNGEFGPKSAFPVITVKTNSRKKAQLFYSYLLFDPDGDTYVSIASGVVDSFKSGDILPQFTVLPEWAGMKLKISLTACNSKGEYGSVYETGEYVIKKEGAGIDEAVIPFNNIFGSNGIANSTFEQGMDGWNAEGKAQIKWEKTITSDNSVGSAYIRQTAGKDDGISCDLRIRRYRQYQFTADVRLKENYPGETKIQAMVVFDNNGTENVINLGNVLLSNTAWAELKADFVLSAALEALGDASAEENLYRNAKIIFKAARVKEAAGENNLTEFYVDNVFMKAVNQSLNPQLGDNREGWSDRTAAKTVSFDPAAEGVAGLIEAGEFPDIDKCVKITSAAGAFADSPQQTFYMDPEKYYEVSAWVKSEDRNEDAAEEPAPDYIELVLGRNGSQTYTCHGRTAVSDGKWHHIKAVISYPKTAADSGYPGDALMFLRYSANNGNVYGAAPDQAKTFYVAELGIKELENTVTNPYFVIGNGWNYWYGHEYCGEAVNNNTGRTYVTPASAVTTGYGGDTPVKAVIDPNSAAVKLGEGDISYIDWDFAEAFDSFDGGFAYGKMALRSAEYDSFWYTAELQASTSYQISAWIQADAVPEDNLQVVTYVGDKSNIVNIQNIAGNEWVKTVSLPYLYTGAEKTAKIGFYLQTQDGKAVSGGNILFENLTVKKVTDIIPEAAAALTRVVCGSDGNSVRVSKLNDIEMGYRCDYYLSAQAGSMDDAVRIATGQSDINAEPTAFYCNLGWNGKYICAAITPVSRFGVYGKTVYTDWVQVRGGFAFTHTQLSVPADNVVQAAVEIQNDYTEDVWASILFAYTDQEGELKGISAEKALLRAGSNTAVNAELLVDNDYESGTVTVYAWLGSESGLTKFAPLAKQIPMR